MALLLRSLLPCFVILIASCSVQGAIERFTGVRVFEFRNYTIV